jgi:hypothetical protein
MKFYDLFEGNPSAYGMDTSGGVICVRDSAEQAVESLHLGGESAIGLYPMYNNKVRWGCSDIDTGSFMEARTLKQALTAIGFFPWIELSRSKGYHVWVFASGWVHGWQMRRAFLFAHGLTLNTSYPVSPTEVNPKSEFLDEGVLGNFVRLPYVGKGPDENGRRVMIGNYQDPIPFEHFVEDAYANRASVGVVARAADRYKPVARLRSMNEIDMPSDEASKIARRLNGKGFTIFRDGPPAWDSRRSQAMSRLAIECKRSGLTEAEAFVLVSDLDERLGKWTDHADPDHWRWTCVQWGYANG